MNGNRRLSFVRKLSPQLRNKLAKKRKVSHLKRVQNTREKLVAASKDKGV